VVVLLIFKELGGKQINAVRRGVTVAEGNHLLEEGYIISDSLMVLN
jgi:hypothetical protein